MKLSRPPHASDISPKRGCDSCHSRSRFGKCRNWLRVSRKRAYICRLLSIIASRSALSDWWRASSAWCCAARACERKYTAEAPLVTIPAPPRTTPKTATGSAIAQVKQKGRRARFEQIAKGLSVALGSLPELRSRPEGGRTDEGTSRSNDRGRIRTNDEAAAARGDRGGAAGGSGALPRALGRRARDDLRACLGQRAHRGVCNSRCRQEDASPSGVNAALKDVIPAWRPKT